MKQITLQEFGDTFSLSYAMDVSGSKCPKFYIPRPRVLLVLDVYINGNKLDNSNHCMERLHVSLVKSAFWKQILFELSPPDHDHGSLSLYLKCKLFADLLSDFKHTDNVAFVERIHIVYKYHTPCSSVYYSCLFNNLQYSLASLMLDLEKDYPFVFSFYGKHLFEINYHTLIRCFTELATPLQGPGEADSAEILQLVLEKLHHFSLTKYNTVEVMKECDKSSYRLQQCRKSISRPWEYEDKRMLRNVALVYRVLHDPSEQSE